MKRYHYIAAILGLSLAAGTIATAPAQAAGLVHTGGAAGPALALAGTTTTTNQDGPAVATPHQVGFKIHVTKSHKSHNKNYKKKRVHKSHRKHHGHVTHKKRHAHKYHTKKSHSHSKKKRIRIKLQKFFKSY